MPTAPSIAAQIEQLASGELRYFGQWPHEDVPLIAAGVYTVWMDDALIYVGMSGRGWTRSDVETKRRAGTSRRGLWGRLNSHASGHRSGDQFCVYVCDRYIIPDLSEVQIQELRGGRLSLDRLTRDYIRSNFAFRFTETVDGKKALEIEHEVRGGALGGEMPILNPRI